MEVLDWDFTREIRNRSVLSIGSLSFDQNYGVHNNSLGNLGRALQERVFLVQGENGLQPPPRPSPNALQLGKFRELWVSNLQGCHRVPHDMVVRAYKGRKASRYSDAFDSLEENPVCEDDSKLTAFLKCEKTNLTVKGDPAPRLIQFPNPRYSLELMTYLKFSEKKFMKAIDAVWGEPTVMSGYNCEELGVILSEKWDSFRNPVAVPLDFSRFDQHTSTAALEYEFEFYQAAFPGDEHLKELLSWQLHPRGVAVAGDGAISYHCPEGGRGSGQINTSMGNKIIVCGLMWEYFQEVGLSASLANMGDDCVIFLEQQQLNLLCSTLQPWWLERGYNAITEKPCYELEKIEFCQSNPVEVNGEWIMVRNPEKALSKDCITLASSETPSQIASAYMAISTCGRIINSGVPISFALHSAIHRAARRYTKDVEINPDFMFRQIEFGNFERMRGLTYRRKDISDETRLSYYRAFGIAPETQIMLESYYNALSLDLGAGVEDVNSLELYTALSSHLLTNTLD
nr:RNA polymerase [Flumine tombus-like virus 7]